MPESRVARKLAAVLCADVAGYSRLTGRDEEGTHARFKALQRDFINPGIEQHHGRVVRLAGDGILVEFASVVEAVHCAIELQPGMTERNGSVPTEKRIEFRIGINLGDIILDGDDIFGDGVNIAARLEALAEPGGICISETVLNHAHGKLAFDVMDAGEQTLKNIVRPVHVYRILLGAPGAPVVQAVTEPPLALPDRPSIAVLPFQNMSGDREQDYFSDGMVEDIITELSRYKWLFVIARNSSFIYKNRPIHVKQVGRELGVRYVLEGSVRKAASRIRINAQLIDAITDSHIWADRYDGPLEDIFALQDRVTSSVVAVIEPSLRDAEIERARRKPTEKLDAYDLYLRALPELLSFTLAGYRESRRLLRQALEIDPKFSLAMALLGFSAAIAQAQGFTAVPPDDLQESLRYARAAIEADPYHHLVLNYSAYTLSLVGHEHERALMLLERSLTLNANSAFAWRMSAWVNCFAGNYALAIERFERARRLSPVDPQDHNLCAGISSAYYFLDRDAESASWARKSIQQNPIYGPPWRFLAASCENMGLHDQAREAARRLLELTPDFTLSRYAADMPYQDKQQVERFLGVLRKAGVPD